MGGIFSSLPTALRIAVRRLNGNRRLMAAVAIGVILAVALMASTTIYRNALQDLGLQTDLRRVSDADLDVRILNAAHGLSSGLAEESFETIDRRLRIPREYISDTKQSLTSATFFMTEVGGIPPDEDPRDRARVLWFEGVQEQIELVEASVTRLEQSRKIGVAKEGVHRREPLRSDLGQATLQIREGRSFRSESLEVQSLLAFGTGQQGYKLRRI